VERDLIVEADQDQLFRILLNLSRNALQALESRAAHDPGRDQIRITGRREGAVVVIEVSDTGPGFSEKAQAHMFEAFPGLDPDRRLRPRLGDRRRTGARPLAATSAWSKAPSGRRCGSPSPTAPSSSPPSRRAGARVVFVIPDRRAASIPESIIPAQGLWIPGSRAPPAPRNDG